MPPECFEKSNRTEASQNASWYLLFSPPFFLICAAALDVLSFPQIGTTSGGEREQEDFMSMCGPSDLWKCFGRDQVRRKRLFFLIGAGFRFPSCCKLWLAELECRMGRLCSRKAAVVQRGERSVARDSNSSCGKCLLWRQIQICQPCLVSTIGSPTTTTCSFTI